MTTTILMIMLSVIMVLGVGVYIAMSVLSNVKLTRKNEKRLNAFVFFGLESIVAILIVALGMAQQANR